MKNTYSLSVIEFAVSSPRQGSIDTHSGFGNDKNLGQEMHQIIQQEHRLAFAEYESEFQISHRFVTEDNIFKVTGKMDGIYQRKKPIIEEIKTSFNIYELQRYIKKNMAIHPYCLQLLTYGYLYWLKHKEMPTLSLYLASTRKKESVTLLIDFNIDHYEAWLKLRLADLDHEVRLSQKTLKRRRSNAERLTFPFKEPRQGQIELIETVQANLRSKKTTLLQAPTGLGKTMGVLYPNLEEALQRGQKVIYVTPKNSQHGVAEEAVDLLSADNTSIRSLTITAKSKLCLKGEPICNSQYCEFAQDHYTKITTHQLREILFKKRKLTHKTFNQLAKTYQVCPFELQFEAVPKADVIICDYNYVFAPTAAMGRVTKNFIGTQDKPNLIIDEIHNLPSRSMDYYSPTLSVSYFENILNHTEKLFADVKPEAEKLLRKSIALIEGCQPKEALPPCKISPPIEVFIKHDAKLRDFLSKYLNSQAEITSDDLIMRFVYYWSEFTSALEFINIYNTKFFTTFHAHPATIKITCCDASEMLKPCYKDFEHIVGFSATLKPFNYYSQLTGLQSHHLHLAEFLSPFPKENRKVLLIPQVSTKYTQRSKSIPRIIEVIQRICVLKKGNYFVFFPSFEFMEKTAMVFKGLFGFNFICQKRGITKKEVAKVLELLKHPFHANIVFAVQGGVFSEGVDYPGNMVIGAFIIGPPLPTFDLESETKRQYYQSTYAAGFDYTYIYPAMTKAIQSAGRVIRSETDKGIIILMDERFMQPSYSACMPKDWFQNDPRELVSTKILHDISQFWAESHSN